MLSVEDKLLLRYGLCLEAEERDTFDLRPHLLPSAVMAAGEEDEGEEDEGDDDTDDESEDEDEEDEDEEDEDEDEDDKSKAKSKRRPARSGSRLNRANRQAARSRVKAREANKALEAANKKLKELEDKDKPQSDKDKRDHEDLKKKFEEVSQELAKYKRRETIKSLADEFDIVDTSLLRVVLEDNSIEQDEDGEWPDDIDKKLKRLIKKHPGLVARSNGKKDDEDDEDEDEKRPPSVRSAGRGGKKTKANKTQDLVKKFPALAGRVR